MLNQKDAKIIANLRKDARMPLTKMSKATQIPVSTIFDRLRLNEKGIIIKHVSLLDFSKLGYNARANITLKVDRSDKEALKQFLMKSEHINSLFKINNGYDFMIEGVFKQIKEMEEFLDMLDHRFNILERNSFFIIEDLKKEEFMSEPELLF